MFDNVNVNIKLPDGYESKHGFQTKDFYNEMEDYEITSAGRLVKHHYEYESTPEDELPYKDSANPIMRLCGCIRRKEDSYRKIDLDFHGILRFYDYDNLAETNGYDEKLWHEYSAKFTDGILVSIEKLTRED